MKIKSPFRDYYDCIQKYGQDDDLLYLRYAKEYRLEEYYRGGIYIGFCGKVYPVDRWKVTDHEASRVAGYKVYKAKYCYNIEDCDKIIETEGYSKQEKRKYYEKSTKVYRRYGRSKREELAAYFAGKDQLDYVSKTTIVKYCSAFFEKYETPIFVLTDRKVETDAQLNIYEFYRVRPPYDAFQDLTVWLSNIAKPFRPIPAVSDADLAAAKGYDRFSFRKVRH